MTNTTLRIATRSSDLALWQAHEVKRQLQALDAKVICEIVPIHSDGDLAKTQGFDSFGYKGIFTKRIEAALLDGRADIAVHSMKDVHSELPESLMIAATLPREDVRDAFLSQRYESLEALPAGAKVGTASVRRGAVVRSLRPDLEIVPFRGNVPTRLKKLARGDVDATFLAVAGLNRLGLEAHITHIMDETAMLPAAAQGAIGIECRRDDERVRDLLARLNHAPTFQAVMAERALLREVDGDCHTPLCALARLDETAATLTLQGIWYEPDGSRTYQVTVSGSAAQAETLGTQAGRELLAQKQAGTV